MHAPSTSFQGIKERGVLRFLVGAGGLAVGFAADDQVRYEDRIVGGRWGWRCGRREVKDNDDVRLVVRGAE